MARNNIARLAAFLTLVALVPAFAQTSPGEFTMAVLPDTQFYSKSYPQILIAETDWISKHAQQMNIRLVVGLGDIVDSGAESYQWQNADIAYRTLDGKVPYVAAIGNHDYDRNNPAGRTGSTKNFNGYFGPQRYAGKSWYKGQYPQGSNENFYSIFNFAGKQYMVLVLECFPRDSVLGWAHSVMKNHPGIDTILVTHAYTYADNTRMDRCDSNNANSFNVANDNDGEQVWEKFASRYSSITMVLSGHVVQGDGTGRRTDLGVNGNLVNQMLSDFQSWPNGGNGYIRLVTVRPALNQVIVRTFSPYLNQWLTDSHNQYSLPYKNSGLTASVGSISGKVKSTNCAAVAGAYVSDGSTTVVTDANGMFSLPGTGPRRYTLTVTQPGAMSAPQPSSIVPVYQRASKVLLAKTGQLSGKATWKLIPLANANVALTGGALRMNLSTTTASNGAFSFGEVPYGTYNLTVHVPGTTINSTYTVSVTAGSSSYVSAGL